jgi:hypothetical protein
MTGIYCGNNKENTELKNGNVQLGTRYNCLRKGIGKGLHESKDPSYAGKYEPIDKRKIYCGNQTVLPDNYDSMGNLPQCLQKGIGIGKHKKASQFMTTIKKNYTSIIIGVLVLVITLILLLTLKPKFITKLDEYNVRHIDIPKFLLVYSLICIIVILFMYFSRNV